MNSRLQFAAELTKRGIAVFPCLASKAPATKNGFKDATTDEAQVRDWFTNTNYLVGVPTGHRNRLLVLDIDPAGKNWLSTHLSRLDCQRMHSTPRGKHFIFTWPQGFSGDSNTVGRISNGVDTRGEGGYVIWWPASGGQFIGSLENLTVPPAWLLNALSKLDPNDTKKTANGEPLILKAGSRNSGLTSLAGGLRRAGLDEGQLVAQLQIFNSQWCRPPLSHREIKSIAQSISRYKPDAPITADLSKPISSLDWIKEFEMTEDEVAAIQDPQWIIPNLVPQAHLVTIAAPPGAGKTTIVFHLCKSLADKLQVVYVHADTNPSDAKDYFYQAKQAGIRYLTPDMKIGLSMSDVVERLEGLAKGDMDLNGQVWIFDTLKKMVDVIQKKSLKDFLQTMRKLSSRGMTIVLLAHTNKHKDQEGQTLFEGTGDLKSDSDELIYLEAKSEEDGTLLVSTRLDKVRADIEPISFSIDKDRNVFQMGDFVDIQKQISDESQRQTDQPVIDLITEAINNSHTKQFEILDYCRGKRGFGEHKVRSVLKRYSHPKPEQLWRSEKLANNNTWRYQLVRNEFDTSSQTLPLLDEKPSGLS